MVLARIRIHARGGICRKLGAESTVGRGEIGGILLLRLLLIRDRLEHHGADIVLILVFGVMVLDNVVNIPLHIWAFDRPVADKGLRLDATAIDCSEGSCKLVGGDDACRFVGQLGLTGILFLSESTATPSVATSLPRSVKMRNPDGSGFDRSSVAVGVLLTWTTEMISYERMS